MIVGQYQRADTVDGAGTVQNPKAQKGVSKQSHQWQEADGCPLSPRLEQKISVSNRNVDRNILLLDIIIVSTTGWDPFVLEPLCNV